MVRHLPDIDMITVDWLPAANTDPLPAAGQCGDGAHAAAA
jgi:hypothetical protein